MKKDRSIWFFIVLVFLIPLTAFGIYNWYETKMQRLPILIDKDHQIDSFSLITQDNQVFSLSNWDDMIIVTDFFFTHCPSICPKMTQSMSRVQEYYANDKEVFLTSFSVDPERDSVSQLKQYCAQRKINNNNWSFLTGDKKEIYKLARNSFRIVATDGDGGPEDFIHSEKLVLIDKQKRIRGYYDGTNSKETDQLIIDIKKLKHEN